jgi:16S rRNA (guanine966-N2)-methyltransferase
MAGTLRITGGRLARRRMAVPEAADHGEVRPTSDRVREALFSSLEAGGDVADARVLDAFAGSGALGIEALSRGATEVVFIERSKRVGQVLAENLAALGLKGQTEVLLEDAPLALARLEPASFDLVLADPPYKLGLAELSASLARLLRPGGLLVLERDKRSDDVPPPGLLLERDRVYGSTRVTLWRRP